MTGLNEHRERLNKLLEEAKALEAEIDAMSSLKECWEKDNHEWDALVDGDFNTVTRIVMKCKRCSLVKDIIVKVNERKLKLHDKSLSSIAEGFQEERDAEVESIANFHHEERQGMGLFDDEIEPHVYRLDSNSVLAHRLSRIGDN